MALLLLDPSIFLVFDGVVLRVSETTDGIILSVYLV